MSAPRRRRRKNLFLPLMGLPATLFVLALGVWPVAQGVYDSLLHDDLQRPAKTRFAGLSNYADFWADPTDRQALLNTMLFTLSAVGIELVLGLALALLLWRDARITRMALALLLVPVTITPLAVGLIFRALLNADFGLIGYWARVWGISGPHGFLASPATALPTLVAIDVWEWTPLMALILTAGLKAIPPELIEAAAIDGARGMGLLRHVIVPLILPTALIAVTIRGMDAFRVFDTVFATTQGGPDDATSSLMFEAVKQGLEFFDVGAASAIATVMILCMATLVGLLVLLMHAARRRVQ